MPDGSAVTMRCWEDGNAPTSQDPSLTSPRWFYATEVDHNPGWSGWIYSGEIPVDEQISTPACTTAITDAYPIGDPSPAAVPPLQFTIVGSCTTSGGTLTSASSGFTAGGSYNVAAAYPDGRAYPLTATEGTVRSDGTVSWQWPCAGDPPGTYQTWLVDLSTGRDIGPTDFTISPAPDNVPTRSDTGPTNPPQPPTHTAPAAAGSAAGSSSPARRHRGAAHHRRAAHHRNATQHRRATHHRHRHHPHHRAASPPPRQVLAYDNWGQDGAVGHAMCRGNPDRPESMPGGTASETFAVPAGVHRLESALVQIDPDSSVTAHMTVYVDGSQRATADAAAVGDTRFDFPAVAVQPGQTVTLSMAFTATYGKIITVYTVGAPPGHFTATNTCSDGAPNVDTTATGLRAQVEGWTR